MIFGFFRAFPSVLVAFQLWAIFFLCSCKTQNSNPEYDKHDPDKTYFLQLNPPTGTAYYYDISSTTEMELEVDNKEIENKNTAEIGLRYIIGKDSAGDFLFTMKYDKIHLLMKNNGEETEADASAGIAAVDAMDRMLAILKEATIRATISPSGEIKQINGYQEAGEKIMEGFTDMESKRIAQNQWDQMIGQGVIKKNMDQLFKIFPDSAVHLNDTWTLDSRQDGEFSLNISTTFELKAINKDIAIIHARGKIASIKDEKSQVVADVTGEQEAEFEMEAKTGMLISCKIKAISKGTLQMMGREIPVKIKNTVKMTGRKIPSN